MKSFSRLIYLLLTCILHGNLIYSVFGQFRKASSNKLGSNEYWLFKDRKTWPEAVLQCEKQGMEIAEVRTSNEVARIVQLMMRNRPDAIENAWIGGYAKNKTRGIVWRWISTNEEVVNNELWKNLHISKTNPLKRCLLFDWHLKEEPGFIESSCDMKREYICQKMNNNLAEFEESTRIFFPISSVTSTPMEKILSTMPSTSIKSIINISMKSATQTTASSTDLLNKNELLTNTMQPERNERQYEDYYDYGVSDSSETTTITIKTRIVAQKDNFSTASRLSFPVKKEIQTSAKLLSHLYPISRPKNDSKFINNLKLYYAFEGPMIGGFYSSNSRSNSLSIRKYKKYMPIAKKSSNDYPKDNNKTVLA